jgi:hypothetical protein
MGQEQDAESDERVRSIKQDGEDGRDQSESQNRST